MVCKKCGTNNAEESLFCSNCGAKLDDGATNVQNQQQPSGNAGLGQNYGAYQATPHQQQQPSGNAGYGQNYGANQAAQYQQQQPTNAGYGQNYGANQAAQYQQQQSTNAGYGQNYRGYQAAQYQQQSGSGDGLYKVMNVIAIIASLAFMVFYVIRFVQYIVWMCRNIYYIFTSYFPMSNFITAILYLIMAAGCGAMAFCLFVLAMGRFDKNEDLTDELFVLNCGAGVLRIAIVALYIMVEMIFYLTSYGTLYRFSYLLSPSLYATLFAIAAVGVMFVIFLIMGYRPIINRRKIGFKACFAAIKATMSNLFGSMRQQPVYSTPQYGNQYGQQYVQQGNAPTGQTSYKNQNNANYGTAGNTGQRQNYQQAQNRSQQAKNAGQSQNYRPAPNQQQAPNPVVNPVNDDERTVGIYGQRPAPNRTQQAPNVYDDEKTVNMFEDQPMQNRQQQAQNAGQRQNYRPAPNRQQPTPNPAANEDDDGEKTEEIYE